MYKVTIATGIALSLLGLGFYFGSGGASVTALIPVFFGLPLAALGALAANEERRKHAMHAAAAAGLLGFLGSAGGLLDVAELAGGGTLERPIAAIAKAIMALITGVFVGLCVKSFVDARRKRDI